VSLQRNVQIKPLFNGRASCLRVYWRRGNPDRRIRFIYTLYTYTLYYIYMCGPLVDMDLAVSGLGFRVWEETSVCS